MQETAYSLLTISQPGVQLVSPECVNDDKVVRLVSTRELLWLDERMTRQPLLAVKHGREPDITLRARTFDLTNCESSLYTYQTCSIDTVQRRSPFSLLVGTH